MAQSIGRRLAYLHSQPTRQRHFAEGGADDSKRLAVAISAQTGSGAREIAHCLEQYLQAQAPPQQPAWRVFDRNLITKVLEDHHLPVRLARFIPEDAGNLVDDLMDELFGLRPPSWMVVQQSVQTIGELVRNGHVILLGWGANAVTAQMPGVFQLRLVGSLEKRIARLQEREHLSRKDALASIQRSDRGRARYMKRHFDRQISEVLLYDLTVNTDRLSATEAARCIGGAALSWHRSTVCNTERRPEPETYV